MKFNNKLRKFGIAMDFFMPVFFGILFVILFTQGRHAEAAYNFLLALVWLLVLMKNREISHYVKLINLYEKLVRKQDEYINILVGVLNEKQTDNDTDTGQ